jgi:hypothetical protein
VVKKEQYINSHSGLNFRDIAIGVMEWWSGGVMECWSDGRLELGVMEYWSIGVVER